MPQFEQPSQAPKYEQRPIESFFLEYGVTDADMKARLLPKLTHIIYGYNQNIIKLGLETDEYRREQITRDNEEIKSKIQRDIESEKSGKAIPFAP